MDRFGQGPDGTASNGGDPCPGRGHTPPNERVTNAGGCPLSSPTQNQSLPQPVDDTEYATRKNGGAEDTSLSTPTYRAVVGGGLHGERLVGDVRLVAAGAAEDLVAAAAEVLEERHICRGGGVECVVCILRM